MGRPSCRPERLFCKYDMALAGCLGYDGDAPVPRFGPRGGDGMVNALCLDCREGEHSDDCPLSKAIEAVRSLPTA